MQLLFGADHGGFALKTALIAWAVQQGYGVEDLGAHHLDPTDDYPQFALAVARQIAARASDYNQQTIFGVVICRSSGGITIAANRLPGVRAVAVPDERAAKHARTDNAANMVMLGGDWTSLESAQAIITTFCTTPFSQAERHVRRLNQIAALTNSPK